MKRKASLDSGDGELAKIPTNSAPLALDTKLNCLMHKEPASEPVKSHRQKKPPAWLASYVTGKSSKPVEAANKEAKLPKKKKPADKNLDTARPTHVPSNKTKSVKNDTKSSKINLSVGASGDAHPPKYKKLKKSVTSKPSLLRKSTLVLSALGIDSNDCSKVALKRKHSSKTETFKKLSSSSKKTPSLSSNLSLLKSSPSKCNNNTLPSTLMNGIDSCHLGNTDMLEICDTPSLSTVSDNSTYTNNSSVNMPLFPENEKPTMLEVVICISTSGALKEHLSALKENIRETVWRLQSLIPSLRIGVLAHTQGGIHDDKPKGSSSPDHSYTRTGGPSGTKWLDLGATLSQICAFVDSLEAESAVYPDYVQDNLEMALWKLQRCMTWSSCSYRAVIMVGRGRPNRTSFYHQREHWRGWIRSALELGPKEEIPVIDWELEAKMLSQMNIHVFTVQAVNQKSEQIKENGDDGKNEEDEGTTFFRQVAQLTNAQHINTTDASLLMDIVVAICCSCQSPDLLQEHRDQVRDENDGVLPLQLRDMFVSLQLHSNRRSLATLPAGFGRLEILPQMSFKIIGNKNRKNQSCKPKKEGVNPEHYTGLKPLEGDGNKLKNRKAAAPSKKGLAKSGGMSKVVNSESKKFSHKTTAVKKGRVLKAVGKTSLKNKTHIKKAAIETVKKIKQKLPNKETVKPSKKVVSVKPKGMSPKKVGVNILKSKSKKESSCSSQTKLKPKSMNQAKSKSKSSPSKLKPKANSVSLSQSKSKLNQAKLKLKPKTLLQAKSKSKSKQIQLKPKPNSVKQSKKFKANEGKSKLKADSGKLNKVKSKSKTPSKGQKAGSVKKPKITPLKKKVSPSVKKTAAQNKTKNTPKPKVAKKTLQLVSKKSQPGMKNIATKKNLSSNLVNRQKQERKK